MREREHLPASLFILCKSPFMKLVRSKAFWKPPARMDAHSLPPSTDTPPTGTMNDGLEAREA